MIPGSPGQMLVLAGGAALLFELGFLVKRVPEVGLWMFMAASLAATYRWPSAIPVGGYDVYLLDGVVMIIGLAVILTLARGRHRRLSAIPFILLIATGVTIARGLGPFGTQQAVNSGRALLYVFVAVAFGHVCLGSRVRALQRVWTVSASVFLLIGLSFWLKNGLGTYAGSGERALNSSQALVVAQAGFMNLAPDRDKRARLLAVACMAAVLASQQRTVWAATLFTAVLMASQARSSGDRRRTRVVRRGLVAGLVAVVVLLVAGPSDLRNSTSAAVSGDAVSTEEGTFGWRVQSWQQLVGDFGDRPLTDHLIGQPGGTSLERVIDGIVRKESPHNMYVFVLLSLGVTGLLAFGSLMFVALRESRHRDPLLFAIIAGLLIFSVGYQLAPESGLLIGAAVAMHRMTTRAPDAVAIQ